MNAFSEMNSTAAELAGNFALTASFAKVKVTVQVMLGSTKLTLAEMLALKPGATIALDQRLGEAVSIIVNDTCVAKGELYVLEQDGNRLGVKVTEMVTQNPTGV